MPVEIIDLTESPQVLTVQKARAWQRKGHTWQQKAHPIDSLQTAINATSHQQLKLAVLRLVGSQPLAAEYLEKELLASEDNYKNYDDVSTDEETEEEEEEEEDDGDDDDDDDSEKSDDDIVTSIDLRKDAPKALKQQPVAEVVGQKRKRTRFAMCAQCKEEFDITVNYREACDYHPGELEIDDDAFADHDENTHGPMDTAENRRDFPENFFWTCCKKTGDETSCKTGPHRERIREW